MTANNYIKTLIFSALLMPALVFGQDDSREDIIERMQGSWQWVGISYENGPIEPVDEKAMTMVSGSGMKPPLAFTMTITDMTIRCMVCAGTFRLEKQGEDWHYSSSMDCLRHGWQCPVSSGIIGVQEDVISIKRHSRSGKESEDIFYFVRTNPGDIAAPVSYPEELGEPYDEVFLFRGTVGQGFPTTYTWMELFTPEMDIDSYRYRKIEVEISKAKRIEEGRRLTIGKHGISASYIFYDPEGMNPSNCDECECDKVVGTVTFLRSRENERVAWISIQCDSADGKLLPKQRAILYRFE